jgi:hypothetical protein
MAALLKVALRSTDEEDVGHHRPAETLTPGRATPDFDRSREPGGSVD